MTLAELSEGYQAVLEHHRAALDEFAPDEFVGQLAEDLVRARVALEVAWLDSKFAQSS